MKLRLSIEFDADDDDIYGDCTDESTPASSHPANTTLPHENRTFDSTLLYNVLSGLTRSSYNEYELPLIDVPDDLLFQFMVMGIKDGDHIAYNYETHRIVIANKGRLARRYAARTNDDDSPHSWKRRVGRGNSSNQQSTTMLDFSLHDEESDTPEPEDLVFDMKDIHKDVYDAIKPYLSHTYVKEFMQFGAWWDRWQKPIGPSTLGDSCPKEAEEVYESTVVKMQCPVPREEIRFIFRTFRNNESVFKENAPDIGRYYVEKIRQITVDIIAKCTQSTGSKWDIN